MNPVYILLLMIFFHIVDDYYLQGILASMKQKKWWEKNAPDKKYKNDYVVALWTHSFSWAFMTILPIAYYQEFCVDWKFVAVLFCNMAIHAFVDQTKANKGKLNLCQDQTIHIFQILITFGLFVGI